MGKNIVLFIDGTGNHAEHEAPTNVHKLLQRVKAAGARDGRDEAACSIAGGTVFYAIDGVGTDKPHQRPKPEWLKEAALRPRPKLLHRVVSNAAGSLSGYGISRRIKEAYAFLVRCYEKGDSIYLFGFSRGAFAVRSLAGFIDTVGLLYRRDIAEVEAAYLLYERAASPIKTPLEKRRRPLRRLGAKVRSRDDPDVMPIHMIGVWDTVEALGLPEMLQLSPAMLTSYHVTGVPRFVSHIRHALALHEMRTPFEPLLWKDTCAPDQTLRQIWFAGAHADVGGGYKGTHLSDVALEWMAWEARQLGLPVAARPAPVAPASTLPVHHELHSKFFFLAPRVRRFLATAGTGPQKALLSHALHSSAASRLLAVRPDSYDDFRGSVRDTCARIDRQTELLALRLALLGVSGLPSPAREETPHLQAWWRDLRAEDLVVADIERGRLFDPDPSRPLRAPTEVAGALLRLAVLDGPRGIDAVLHDLRCQRDAALRTDDEAFVLACLRRLQALRPAIAQVRAALLHHDLSAALHALEEKAVLSEDGLRDHASALLARQQQARLRAKAEDWKTRL